MADFTPYPALQKAQQRILAAEATKSRKSAINGIESLQALEASIQDAITLFNKQTGLSVSGINIYSDAVKALIESPPSQA